MTDLADRLKAFIPRHEGYNPDYANTLTEAVEALRAKSTPAEVAQGEAVEVVAHMQRPEYYSPYVSINRDTSCEVVDQLMTVAQHNRIVAAMAPSSPDAELVALLRECRRAPNNLIWPESILRDRIDAKLASPRI
jgi:hypothetical protein